jgi:hypothetical protein
MQRRVTSLEDENRQLRSEASQLALDTEDCEMAEQRLVQDIASQLGKFVLLLSKPSVSVVLYFYLFNNAFSVEWEGLKGASHDPAFSCISGRKP